MAQINLFVFVFQKEFVLPSEKFQPGKSPLCKTRYLSHSFNERWIDEQPNKTANTIVGPACFGEHQSRPDDNSLNVSFCRLAFVIAGILPLSFRALDGNIERDANESD